MFKGLKLHAVVETFDKKVNFMIMILYDLVKALKKQVVD